MSRIKTILAAVLMFLGVLVLATLFMSAGKASGATLNVGSGQTYTTISSAMNAASLSGDTIYIYAGTYSEAVSVTKNVTLEGQSKDTTTIQGTGTGIGISVSSGNTTTIKNLKIDNWQYNILVSSNSNTITNNIISNSVGGGAGIMVYGGTGNTITSNAFSNIAIANLGIYILTGTHTIQSNSFTNVANYSIAIVTSSNNDISLNTFTDVKYGISLSVGANSNTVVSNTFTSTKTNGVCISVMLCSGNTVSSNTINGGAGDNTGIYVIGNSTIPASSTITSNTINNINCGIFLYNTSSNSITGNTVTSCNYGVYLNGSTSNTITNTTISNSVYDDINITYSSTLTTINTTFNASKVNCSANSSLDVENYLNVNTASTSGVTVTVKINGIESYSGTSDAGGACSWILVTDRVYSGSSTATENAVALTLSKTGLAFSNNNRDVNMSASVTESVTLYENIKDENTGYYYETAQDAITAASEGATINLKNGTYNGSITISKTINLTGGSNQDTVIKGTGIANSKGIYLSSVNYANISNLRIDNFEYGVYLISSSSNNNITSSTITNCSRGIYIFSNSNNNVVTNSTITNSTNYDIYIDSVLSLTSINTTFNWSKVYCPVSGSTLTVQNYLDIVVRYASNSTLMQNANIVIKDNGFFTVASGQTNSNGAFNGTIITDRIYSGSNTATENTTTVTVSYSGCTFDNNIRNVNMSTSHTEYFNATVNSAPTPCITSPTENQNFTQGASVSFSGYGIDAEDGFLISVSINWSSNVTGFIGYGNTSTSALPLGAHNITLNVTDSNGATANTTVNITIVATNNAPSAAHITTPTEGQSFIEGNTVGLTGYGIDSEDGFLTGASITWISNISGNLGTGNTSKNNLAVGSHNITLTVSDSTSQTANYTVNITITEAKIKNNNTGVGYATIQDAINASSNGQTIYIKNGTYNEALTISKTITLVGENNQNTIIKRSGSGTAISIASASPGYVNISNIRVDNYYTAIQIDSSSHHSIRYCTFTNNTGGAAIQVLYPSNNNTIEYNSFSSGGYGVYLSQSIYNKVSSNTFTSIGTGVYTEILSNGHNDITYNTFTSCSKGVYLYSSNSNTVSYSTFTNCGYGVDIDGSSNTVESSTITNSAYNAIMVSSGTSNFIGNTTISNSTNYDFYISTSSAITALNTTFNGSKVSCFSSSKLTVQNYLDVVVRYADLSLIHNAQVDIKDNSVLVASGLTFFGIFNKTLVTDRIYDSSSTATENTTTVSVSYPGWNFQSNNRSVNMSTTHTEYFNATYAAKNNNTSVQYGTIQSAIDAASAGDTIFVYNGTYYEQLTITKSINLTGESNQNTIIKGTGDSTGIGVSFANYVNVSNLKIDKFHYGIKLSSSSNNSITGNTVANCDYEGIGFASSSNNNITSNTITNSSYGNGISLGTSSNNNITSNTISNCYWGIYLGTSSNNNTITSNTVANCSIDIYLDWYGTNNTIINTTFNASKVCCDATSTLTVQNYLDVIVRDVLNSTPIQNAYVNVTDNGVLVFTGQTGSDGKVSLILVTDRIYNGSSTATENTTTINVSYPGWAFQNNNRNVDMSISHTEYFTSYESIRNNNTGYYYLTIQDAINAASNGDTIFVKNGTYYENLSISKTINLTGESNQNTIIKGNNVTERNGINVTANYVNISNLKIDKFYYGIYLYYSSNTIIAGNTIMNCSSVGIYLDYCSNNTLTSNTMSNCIYFWSSSNNNITSNTIVNSSGINLGGNSNNNTIARNTANCGSYGLYLSSSSNNNITANTLANCSYYGIYLFGSNNNTLAQSTVSSCNYGVWLYASQNNNITSNTITNSSEYDFYLFGSSLVTTTNTTFNASKVSCDTGSTLTIQNYLDVIVRDVLNSTPIQNAYVNVTNNGTLVFAGQTGSDGKVSCISVTDRLYVGSNTANDYPITTVNISYLGWTFHTNNRTVNMSTQHTEFFTMNQAPSACITTPTNNQSFAQGLAISFVGYGLDDEDLLLTGTSINWSSNVTGYLGSGNITVSNLSIGKHQITLNVTDSDRVTATATANITVAAANNKPTAYITAPTEGQVFAQGATVTFTGYGTDIEDGFLRGASITWTSNISGQIGAGNITYYNFTAVGVHSITLTVTDSISQTANTTVNITVYGIVTNLPSVPSITTTAYTDTDGYYTINWTASSYADKYILEENGTTVIYNGTLLAYQVAYKSDGAYAYRVKAWNMNGTSGLSSAVTITVDRAKCPGAPSITTTSYTDADGNYSINWTASAYATSYLLYEYSTEIYNGTSPTYSVANRSSAIYVYKLVAWNINGTSNYSEITITVGASPVTNLPSAPSITTTTFTDTDGYYAINWTASNYADKYILEENGTTVIYNGTSLTYCVAYKLEDSNYTYRVSAWNINGTSSWSSAITITVDIVKLPGTPSITTTSYTDADGNYSINWTASAYAAYYHLYEYGTEIYNGTSLTYSVANRSSAVYTYKLAAWNINGTSDYSSEITITVGASPVTNLPSAPSITTTTFTDTDGYYAINWTASNYADKYILEENGTTVIYNGTLLAYQVAYKSDGAYAYRVKAWNMNGTSGLSSAVTITVDRAKCPGAPSITTTSYTDADGNYSINWTASAYATSYLLYEYSTEIYNGTSPTYYVTNRSSAVYTYKVAARNINGTSGYSNQIIITVSIPPVQPNLPSTPSITTASYTDTDGNYAINWTASAYAVNYILYENDTQIYNGTNLSYSVTNKPNHTGYIYKVKAWNANGTSVNSSEVIIYVSIPATNPNHVPVIQAIPSLNGVIGVPITYQVVATDADGDTLTYSCQYYGTINATGFYTFTPDSAGAGPYNITIKVNDSKTQTIAYL
ncbi:MAG: right-handed parallel beta-helix repeat-containing protein, partial [Thermoplasmata archaeon]